LAFILLQVLPKSSLDSSFRSTEKIKPESLFSIENPLLFSLLLLIVIVAVMYIYYRFVILPLKQKHLREEQVLRLQQAESTALFSELSPDPIFRIDLAGKVILANNSAHKIFPHRVLLGQEVKNLLPFFLNLQIKEIIEQEMTINHSALVGENYYQFIIEGINKLKICQVYGRDITELKKTEKDLKETLVKAEEVKKIKELFLAQMSHEIRSPLNVIIGYTDMLIEELRNIEKKNIEGILLSIKNNGKRLYRTIDLLLNMSQLQAGKYEARLEKIDLAALITILEGEFSSIAKEKGLTINFINEFTDPIIVVNDYYSMTQIFSNLIDNSIKYTDRGEIKIKLYKDGSNVCVDISDTGKGISREYLDKLFVPFSQEEMGYSRKYEGTGLGLALVKGFLDINKAIIKVKSEVNLGTTFTIVLGEEKKW
jgi:signal transduction histidine kinase